MKNTLLLMFTGFLLVVLGAPTTASMPPNISLFDFAQMSDLVVSGTVVSVDTDKDTAVIKVGEVLKSRSPDGQITLHGIFTSPGSRIGDRVNFHVGEEIVVFLKDQSGRLQVAGDGWGKHVLKPESKTDDIKAIRELIKLTALTDEDVLNRAMIGLVLSDNKLLAQEAQRYVTHKVSHSERRQEYKDALVGLLKHDDPQVRWTALISLQFVKAPEAIPLIIEQTRVGDVSVVSAASMALAHYDTAESVAALIALTQHANPNFRIRAMIDLDDSRRPEAKQAARALLYDKDPKVRAAAPRGLVFWLRRHQADDVVPELISMLNDPVVDVQLGAAQALGESGSITAVEPLHEVLRSESIPQELDGRAVEALNMLSSHAEGSFEIINKDLHLIMDALKRGGWIASMHAIELLQKAATPEAIASIGWATDNHPVESIRGMASRALDKLTAPQ